MVHGYERQTARDFVRYLVSRPFLRGLIMAVHIPIGDVNLPKHLATFVFTDPGMRDQAKMEVYTGWVGVNFSPGGTTVSREEFVSFVPIRDLTIQPYMEDDLLDYTVTVALSAVATVEDEANVAAVDRASVQIESQTGIGGIVNCLVLRVRLAALHVTLHGIAYQVTVLMRGQQPPPQELPPDTRPQ
jgi:hypothetical protein